MTDKMDTNEILSSALDENEQLRAEIARLRSEGGGGQGFGVDDNPLCKGCLRWRMVVAALAGFASGQFIAGEVPGFDGLLRGVAVAVTGQPNAGGLARSVYWLATILAPVAVVVAEWKWTLYKRGYPGLLRAVVDMRNAFKGGLGRK
jgi:hypothetical protein